MSTYNPLFGEHPVKKGKFPSEMYPVDDMAGRTLQDDAVHGEGGRCLWELDNGVLITR